MQDYYVRLESPVFTTYRCQRAADSLDIDATKKSVHEFTIKGVQQGDFNIGLIVGPSGSGKSTLARRMFGACDEASLDTMRPVIDQFPEDYTYDDCAAALMGVGLTSVPCWIRPVHTLSTGQRARADAVMLMCRAGDGVTVIDEWTSVVDRTAAKIMSACISKYARKNNRRIVLVACHYDIIEWLDPDWVIDCRTEKFIDRRLLQRSQRERQERITFDITEVDRSSWRYFSKYHYLSDRLPGGMIRTFGLFHGADQVGFQCFANYVPHADKREKRVMHSNRTVVHPDYAGLGLGIKIINETSAIMHAEGYRVMALFSSEPVYRAMVKSQVWRLSKVRRTLGRMRVGGNMDRKTGFRVNVRCYSFEYIGAAASTAPAIPGNAPA